MRLIFITFLGVLSFGIRAVPAAEEETGNSASRQTIAPGDYTSVSDNDKQMDRAVENAQRTLGFFVAALHAKHSGDALFEIKKGFIDGDKVEHLWVRRGNYDGKKFYRGDDNSPKKVENLHLRPP